jgi:hypothetical protein
VFRDITMFHTLRHALKFQSGGGTIGHPNVLIDGLNVLNYDQGSMGTGDGVKNEAAAIIATGMSGLTMKGLNIEDWWNCHLQITGGSYTVIDGLRCERPKMDGTSSQGNYPVMFVLNNLSDIVTGVDIGSVEEYGTLDYGRVFDFYGSQAEVHGFSGQRNSTLSTVNKAIVTLQSDVAGLGTIVAGGIRPTSPVIGYDPAGNNSRSIRQYNGAPPILTVALPTADAYYNGAMLQQITANVATLYVCRQTAAATYAWTALH